MRTKIDIYSSKHERIVISEVDNFLFCFELRIRWLWRAGRMSEEGRGTKEHKYARYRLPFLLYLSNFCTPSKFYSIPALEVIIQSLN